ncbi:MAG: hypothetical protein AAGG09_15965 [Pseudomonadota bacterium]
MIWMSRRAARATVLALTAVVAIAPRSAPAQNAVTVQSGEHADFSRLAMVLPERTQWEVENVPEGWFVRFAQPYALDLSSVFELIPRDRISNVRQSADGTLVIERACDCRIEVVEVRPRVIAIDVLDGLREPASARPDPAATGSLPQGLTILSTARPGSGAPFPRLGPFQIARNGTESATGQDQAARGASEGAPQPEGSDREGSTAAQTSQSSHAISELAQALRHDLRDAAEAGLIDLAVPLNEDGDQSDLAGSGSVLDGAPNVDLRSGRDLISQLLSPEDEEELQCPLPETFDFLSEGHRETWVAALPDLRSGLVDERGIVSHEGARDLSRAYLRLGFGAEAGLVLAEIPNNGTEKRYLSSLSTIMDQRSDNAPEIWSGLEACETSAALWSLLGHDIGRAATGVNTEAVQAAFFSLPEHLRLHLGEEVSKRLRRAGAPDAAASIENNVAALIAPIPTSASEDVSDDGATKATTLPEVQPGSLTTDVSELLDRFETAMRNGTPLEAEDLALAAALADEYDGTSDGERMQNAIALGHLQRGDVDAALEHFDSIDDGPGSAATGASEREPAAPASLGVALRRSLVSVSDTGLLRLAMHPNGARLHRVLEDDEAVLLADRLVELGFPQQADALLEGRAATTSADLARAQANVHLGSNDPRRALALLAGRSDPGAMRLRAEAHKAMGNSGEAASLYALSGDPEAAARAAWISGDPALVAAFGTPEQQALMSDLPARAVIPRNNGTTALPGSNEGTGTELPVDTRPGEDARRADAAVAANVAQGGNSFSDVLAIPDVNGPAIQPIPASIAGGLGSASGSTGTNPLDGSDATGPPAQEVEDTSVGAALPPQANASPTDAATTDPRTASTGSAVNGTAETGNADTGTESTGTASSGTEDPGPVGTGTASAGATNADATPTAPAPWTLDRARELLDNSARIRRSVLALERYSTAPE